MFLLHSYCTPTITYLLMENKTIAVFVFSFLFMIHCVGIQCLSGEISSFLSLLHAVPSCPSARKDISLRVSTKMCINIPHISPLSLAVSREGRPQEVNEWSRCLARAVCQPSPWYPKTNGLPVALNATFFSKGSGAELTHLKEHISQLHCLYAFCLGFSVFILRTTEIFFFFLTADWLWYRLVIYSLLPVTNILFCFS